MCHVVHSTVILFLLESKLALQYVATSYEVGDAVSILCRLFGPGSDVTVTKVTLCEIL